MLIFATADNLAELARCDHWFADGTFSASPPLFKQLYTVHGIRGGTTIPYVFALMSSQTRVSYCHLLQILKDKQAALQPVSVMTDFEQAAIAAFQEKFPACNRKGT